MKDYVEHSEWKKRKHYITKVVARIYFLAFLTLRTYHFREAKPLNLVTVPLIPEEAEMPLEQSESANNTESIVSSSSHPGESITFPHSFYLFLPLFYSSCKGQFYVIAMPISYPSRCFTFPNLQWSQVPIPNSCNELRKFWSTTRLSNWHVCRFRCQCFNNLAFCFPIVYNSFLSLLQALYVEIYFVFRVE